MDIKNFIDTYVNIICQDKTYIIKSGDTLSQIAKKYKTTVDILKQINGIADQNKIIAGNKLLIPDSKSDSNQINSNNKKKKYKVKSGDTLSAIAKKYKTTVQQLVKLNNIEDEDVIRQGMILLIPIQLKNTVSKKVTSTNKKIQRKIQEFKPNNITGGSWIQTITMPFVIKWQGKVVDNNGNHVVYDDDVNVTTKQHWDGENGQTGIDNFINSCVGKPTIGYGQTDKSIVKKGTITDSEAKQMLLQKLKNIDLFLSKKYKYYNIMNPNQRTALISFSYNLGLDFIQSGTKKLKAYLYAGKLNAMCSQMYDCDNVTQNGKLVKVKGLTNRRQDEMKLFRTPYKK